MEQKGGGRMTDIQVTYVLNACVATFVVACIVAIITVLAWIEVGVIVDFVKKRRKAKK